MVRPLAKRIGRAVDRIITPRARPVAQAPLTERTPLVGGGRAGPASAQTGREQSLMDLQVGAGNLRAVEAEKARVPAQRTGRKEGFGVGLGVGAVGVGGAAAAIAYRDEILAILKDPKDRRSFSQAFADARKAGERTFRWEGKEFTTKLAIKAINDIIKPRPKPQMKSGGVVKKSKMKHGGTVGKKRVGHTDYRKGGLFYKGKK